MADHADVASLLEHSTPEGSVFSSPHLRLDERQVMLNKRRGRVADRLARMERLERERGGREEREKWLVDRARVVDVDVGLLLPDRDKDAWVLESMDLEEDEESSENGQSEEDEGIGDMVKLPLPVVECACFQR